MAVIPILTYPDPILKKECPPVDKINDDIKQLARDMIDTMKNAPGSGLAAPQVGAFCRLIVLDVGSPEEPGKSLVVVNPEIVSRNGELIFEEACLSVLDYSARVSRSAEVTVNGLDLDGNAVTIEATGRLAVVFQHEIDHLDGILFIDRISTLKRDLYKRKLKKIMRQNEAQAG
jgi:peptide deformylase